MFRGVVVFSGNLAVLGCFLAEKRLFLGCCLTLSRILLVSGKCGFVQMVLALFLLVAGFCVLRILHFQWFLCNLF